MAKDTVSARLFGMLLLLTLLITAWCYQPGLYGPFLLDDPGNILRTALNSFEWEEIRAKTDWGNLLDLSRRLTYFSFSLTQWVNGYEPSAFKIQNLLIHLLNGLLIFWLSFNLFALAPNRSRTSARYMALGVMALWLVHPLQVSTVLYAVQRLVLLSSLFTLLALISYIYGRRISRERPLAGILIILGGVSIFGLLGFMSKENAALIPIFIALIEWLFFRFSFQSLREKQLIISFLSFVVVLPILVGFGYLIYRWNSFLGGYAIRDFNLIERLMTQVHVLWLYLKFIFLPIPTQMSLFHDAFPIQRTLDAATIIGASGLSILFVVGITLRTRMPMVGFGILWFFACHLMESTIIPLELVFEHRNYLALWGPAFIVVALVTHQIENYKSTVWRIGLLVVPLFFILSIGTHHRAYLWGDPKTLFASEYVTNPQSPRVLAEQASIAQYEGDTKSAIAYIKQLQQLRPNEAGAFIDEIQYRCMNGHIQNDAFSTAKHLLESRPIKPYTATSLSNLVSAYSQVRCPSLTYDQMYNLTQSAIINDLPKTWRTHLSLLVNHAKVAFLGRITKFTSSNFTELLDTALRTPSDYYQTILDLYSFTLKVSRVDEFLYLANQLPEKHHVTVMAVIGHIRSHEPNKNGVGPYVLPTLRPPAEVTDRLTPENNGVGAKNQ